MDAVEIDACLIFDCSHTKLVYRFVSKNVSLDLVECLRELKPGFELFLHVEHEALNPDTDVANGVYCIAQLDTRPCS